MRWFYCRGEIHSLGSTLSILSRIVSSQLYLFKLQIAEATINYIFFGFFSGRPKVVRVGNLKLESSYADDFATPQLRNIIQIIAHPQYKYPSEYHDIAVFKLDQPITFGYYTRQACLSPYPTNDGVVNNTVFAAGWGVTDWGWFY